MALRVVECENSSRRIVDRRRTAAQDEQRLLHGDEIPDLVHELDHAVVLLGQGHPCCQVEGEHDFRRAEVLDLPLGRWGRPSGTAVSGVRAAAGNPMGAQWPKCPSRRPRWAGTCAGVHHDFPSFYCVGSRQYRDTLLNFERR